MDNTKGLYLGTEINEVWWRRYSKDGFFMRGNGEYWHDTQGFYLLRYLTKTPLFIPFKDIAQIKSGTWHAGRWAFGNIIVKILWKKDNLVLSSGFIVSNKKDDGLKLMEILKPKIGGSQKS